MSNQIYFTGFRPEHFSGYNGTSVPSYNSTVNSSSIFYDSNGYMEISSATNVLWKDLSVNDFNDVYFMVTGVTLTPSGLTFSIIDESDNSIYTYFDGASPDGRFYNRFAPYEASYNATTKSTTTKTGIAYITSPLGSPVRTSYPFICYFHLSSTNGTSYTTLSVSYCEADSSSSLFSPTLKTVVSNYTLATPLTNLKSIFISGYNRGYTCYCSNVVVSDFNLETTYLDCKVVSRTGNINQWSGDTTTFSTIPVNYSATGGMYSNTAGSSVCYQTPNFKPMGGYSPLAMILSSNDITTSVNSISYTNGYSGTYTVSIPNYLANGTGISIVSYVTDSGALDVVFQGRTLSGGYYYPAIAVNPYGTTHVSRETGYSNSSSHYAYITDILNYGAWNQFTIFNNNGTLTYTVNGSSVTLTKDISESILTFFVNSNKILAGIAYINTSAIPTYPFNNASNVTSYIDFAYPNNPVVYGDTSQLSITSKSLTSSIPISGVPNIYITSPTSTNSVISPFVTNGTTSITTSDISTVSSSGTNSTFYLMNDPLTNSNWTSSNIQSYQFGLTKIQ